MLELVTMLAFISTSLSAISNVFCPGSDFCELCYHQYACFSVNVLTAHFIEIFLYYWVFFCFVY